jgi:hypothetical protein
MAIIPLGGERFVDTSTGRTFSTTGGGYFAAPAPEATPNLPVNVPAPEITPQIKIATPDIMIGKDDPMSIEIMTDLIFEDIGGQEIINIARTDLVNGQNILYQPIKNLSEIASQYNSNNILSLENTSETIFNNFPIRMDTHIPKVGNGPNGIPVYIDSSTGNIIVEVVNMDRGEQVEVEVLITGTLLDDTIY